MFSFPNFESVLCSMSSSNCYFLTCIQVSQEAGHVVWYSHLFKNFPWILLETSTICFHKNFTHFHLNASSESVIASKKNSRGLSRGVAGNPGFPRLVPMTSGSLAGFLWEVRDTVELRGNENWPFPVLWPLLSFPNLLAYGVQHFHSIIFQDLE